MRLSRQTLLVTFAVACAAATITACTTDKSHDAATDKSEHPKGDHPKGEHPEGEHPKKEIKK